MEMLSLILMLSAIMWYLIDRVKTSWANLSWGKYITMAVSAIGASLLVFSFELDILVAFGVVENVTVAGKVITAIGIMSGSSGISELVGMVKGK
jgi:hypothetical protein